MRRVCCIFTLVFLIAAPASAQDHEDRHVEEGGISAPGWQGMVDNGSSGSVNDAKLSLEGETLHATTGPNITYWHPDNTATGEYTVSATFTEPEYMNLNEHPHPAGLFIGGSDLGTADARYLYCAAYGNGTFIVRGFGPEPFQMNGRRSEEHEAVNKAPGKGKPVSQDISLAVNDDNVECVINGEVVASYPKSEVVGDGKLKSTDGIYGVRLGHNVEWTVEGLSLDAE